MRRARTLLRSLLLVGGLSAALAACVSADPVVGSAEPVGVYDGYWYGEPYPFAYDYGWGRDHGWHHGDHFHHGGFAHGPGFAHGGFAHGGMGHGGGHGRG